MKKLTRSRHRQKGLSSVGWIAMVGIFGLLLLGFFKVFPMYYENFKLKSVLEAVSLDESLNPRSKAEIWNSLSKKAYINEVRGLKREHVTMERKDGKMTVTVSYEKRDNYVGNLFIGGKFVESVVIER